MGRARFAVLYEHPEWFKPLLAELEQRGMSFTPLYAGELYMTRRSGRFRAQWYSLGGLSTNRRSEK